MISKLIRYFRRKFNLLPKLVQEYIGQNRLTLRENSLRSKTDYDDAWLYLCAKHADVVFDVGANVGGDSLYALVANDQSRVFVIEANPKALMIAADNIIRNNFAERVQFVSKFINDKESGKVQFWTVGTGAAGSQYKGHAITASKANESIELRSTTLDELCRQFNVVPDFVKVDVEGAESEVLGGCKSCVKSHKTRFLIEMHSNPELTMQNNADFVLHWCSENDYSAYYLSKGELLTTSDTIKTRGRCHLLLQPSTWDYPNWLENVKQSTPLSEVLS